MLANTESIWRDINATSQCPCIERRSEAPCVLQLGSDPAFTNWLDRACSRLDLDAMFRFVDGQVDQGGWRTAEDPDGAINCSVPARVAVGPEAGVPRGSYDSPTSKRRRTPLDYIVLTRAMDRLEEAAMILALETGVPLPVHLEVAWEDETFNNLGDRLLRELALAVGRDPRAAIASALQDATTARYLGWLAAEHPARFEAVLLNLEPHCAGRHVRALRRAVVAEAARCRADLRARLAREISAPARTARTTEHDVAGFVDALVRFITTKAADRLWRGSRDRDRVRFGSEFWVGRVSDDDNILAIDAKIVSVLAAPHGDPEVLLTCLRERGMLKCSPSGQMRWQQRVGGRGRRLTTVAFDARALLPPPRALSVDEL